jgi:hypothetical protein
VEFINILKDNYLEDMLSRLLDGEIKMELIIGLQLTPGDRIGGKMDSSKYKLISANLKTNSSLELSNHSDYQSTYISFGVCLNTF